MRLPPRAPAEQPLGEEEGGSALCCFRILTLNNCCIPSLSLLYVPVVTRKPQIICRNAVYSLIDGDNSISRRMYTREKHASNLEELKVIKVHLKE